MKRLTLILIVSSLFSLQLQAQEGEKTPIGGRPNIKGDLFLDFGFNILNNRPEDLNTRFFASRVFNVYYQTVLELGERSGLTLNPGIGLGLEKMAFTENRTLVNDPTHGSNASELVPIRDLYGDNIRIESNTMAVNYIDIPIEFRYHLNRDDYNKGFRIAIGGKVGFLYNAHTKVKFTDENDLTQKIKNRQEYGLNKIRYGIYTRVGTPGFNVWSYYGLNSVFKQGPFGTEATQFNFGLSVALF